MKNILKIRAPNGEIKDVEVGSTWKEICPIFQIFDGWFVSINRNGEGWTEEWLIQNGKPRGVIDGHHSGFWKGDRDEDYEWLQNPTREDIERRLKLLAFQ